MTYEEKNIVTSRVKLFEAQRKIILYRDVITSLLFISRYIFCSTALHKKHARWRETE